MCYECMTVSTWSLQTLFYFHRTHISRLYHAKVWKINTLGGDAVAQKCSWIRDWTRSWRLSGFGWSIGAHFTNYKYGRNLAPTVADGCACSVSFHYRSTFTQNPIVLCMVACCHQCTSVWMGEWEEKFNFGSKLYINSVHLHAGIMVCTIILHWSK